MVPHTPPVRTFKDEATYKKIFTEYAEYTQAGSWGTRMMFSFLSKERANTAYQVFWFDGMPGFLSQPKDRPELSANLWAEYAGTPESDTCYTFGANAIQRPVLKHSSSSLPNVTYVIEPTLAGYLKHVKKDGGPGLEGPPILFFNKREILPGKMAEYADAFVKMSKAWKADVPGLLGALDFVSPTEPDTVWDVRVMSNMEDGFAAHTAAPSVQAVLPSLFGLYANMDFKEGVAFSPDGAALDAANPGNGVYTKYDWADIIGPMPDFAKAIDS